MNDIIASNDPFEKNDPFSSSNDPFGGPRARQRSSFRKPLPDDESESFAKQALNTGASGLQYVLGTLDKPGQAVRGLLAGKGASSLKHLIPFAESAGLTNESDHTTGRDLTDKIGLTSRGDKGWGSWGAGLAADIATDPLTYATFGAKHALTGTGKALQKSGALKGWGRESLLKGFDATESALSAAGKSASEIAHIGRQGKRIATPAMEAAGAVANEPLSGLARIGVPFGPGVSVGTGPLAQRIARAGDRLGDKLKFGNPLARTLNANFDNSVGAAVDEITQKGWQKHGQPALEAAKSTARDDAFQTLQHLDPLISSATHTESTITDAARAAGEGVPHNFDPKLIQDLDPLVQHIDLTNARQLSEAQAVGAPLNALKDDYVKYVHRQPVDVNHQNLQMGGRKNNLYSVTSGSNVQRDPVLANIPGGTNRINNWFNRFASEKAATSMPIIRQELEADLLRGGKAMTPDLHTAFDEKAIELAERLQRANPKYRNVATTATEPAIPGLPFFTPDLAGDLSQRGAQHARTLASAKAAIGTIADSARPFTNDGTMMSVPQLMKQIGLKTIKHDPKLGNQAQGAMVEVLKALAPKGAPMVDSLLTANHKLLKGAVGKYGVSNEHAGQILKAYEKWSAPEQIKAPLKFVDSFTNAFKALSYPIWIPSHVRNAMTAGVNNLRRGVGLGDYADQLKIMTGRGSRDLGNIGPAFKALPEAERINAIRRQQYASANLYGGHGMNDDISRDVADALSRPDGRFTPLIPGSDRSGPHGNVAVDTADLMLKQGLLGSLKSTGGAIKDSIGGLFNKSRGWGQGFSDNLGIKGVGGVTKDVNPAVKAGRVAGTNIEDFFRGAQWLREVKNGSTPAMAADQINKLHFDYDALAPFEKNVMKRIVPFYTFASRNLLLQMETVTHNPGVINANYKPFYQKGPEDKGYVPQYLANGVAIPTGPEVDGKRQYVSKLGLPAEEAFGNFHFKNGLPDVGATALSFMSQMNPLIKGPMEQLFDKQFHTGRKLSDLRATGTAGALSKVFGEESGQPISQLLANTPATRFVSTIDKMIDDRKGIIPKAANLLTGVKVSDVDTDKQKAIELRNAVEDMMKGHSNLSKYQSFYVKPEDVQNLSPEEIDLMRMYSGIQDQAKLYAKEKRAKIGVKP
jgi:hypothetical protein